MTIIIESALVFFWNVLKLPKLTLQKQLPAVRLVYFPIYLKFMKDNISGSFNDVLSKF